MHEIVQAYHYLTGHPEIWITIFGAGGVSVITQFVKKAAKLENNHVIQILFGAISLVATGVHYLLGAHNLPPTILGVQTASMIGIGQLWYTHLIKPIDGFVQEVKNFVANDSKVVNDTGSDSTVIEPTVTPPTANF